AAAESHDDALARHAVGNSSVIQARRKGVVADWKKTMAPKRGHNPDVPSRKKTVSATVRPSRKTMALGRRPRRSATSPPTHQPGRPRPPAMMIMALVAAGDQPCSVIGTYAVNAKPATS